MREDSNEIKANNRTNFKIISHSILWSKKSYLLIYQVSNKHKLTV